MVPDKILEDGAIRNDYRARHEHVVSSWRKWLNSISYLAASPTVLRVRPLLFAFSMCIGSIVYFYYPTEPDVELVGFMGAIVLISMFPVLLRAGPALSLLALVLIGIMAGIGAAKIRTVLVDSHRIGALTGPVMVEGWIAAIEPASRGVRVRLNVHAVAGMAQTDKPQTIRLTHTARLAVAPGRFVRCWAIMRPPPGPALAGDYNFERQAWFQGLDAVGYVRGRCRGGVLGEPGPAGNQRKLRLASLQRNLALYVKDAAGTRAGGFAAALVAGDRSFMSEADREALRGSGLAHILAISGLHLGIVGGLVFFMFRRGLSIIEPLALRIPVQKPAAMAALVVCCMYLILSGASVSTQRAFIMAAVIFGAILIDRPGISLRSYAVAMMIIVALRPESVLSPGFQMSFAATGALITVYEAWNRSRRGAPQGWFSKPVFAVKSLAVTSFVAAVATGPFALYHFNRIAGFGLAANLLAMPVITFGSAPAAGLSMVLAPFGLAGIGLRLFGYSLEIVLAIAHYFEGLGQALHFKGTAMPDSSLAFFALALAAGIIAVGRYRYIAASLFATTGAMLWMLLPNPDIYWVPSGDVFIRTETGDIIRTRFIEGDGLGSLRFSRQDYTHACDTGPCFMQTRSGAILLQHAPLSRALCEEANQADIKLILLAPPVPDGPIDGCPPRIRFKSIQTRGGVSVWLRGGDIGTKYADERASRPWQEGNMGLVVTPDE